MQYKAVVLALLLIVAVPAFAGSVVFTFDYDFTADPACTSLVLKNCVDHFELWDGPVGGTKIGDVPLPAIALGTVTGISATFNVNGYGSHVVNAVAVARDGTGTPNVQSGAVSSTIIVKPNPPKNFLTRLLLAIWQAVKGIFA